MIKKNRKRIIYFAIFLTIILWIIYGNVVVGLNKITMISDKIPDSFNGYKIAHVSDLHNDKNKNNQLITLLEKVNPDIIAITGDMIDSYKTNIEVALAFAEEAMNIAPCYYVTGNHEASTPKYSIFKQSLIELGVTVLEDSSIPIVKSNDKINLIGLNDPNFSGGYSSGIIKRKLEKLTNEETYNILLSHRPELFNIYVECGVDLVLSGHAHGGQFRLPFIGGLVAPNQGIFPKYDSGLYRENNTNMIVSRGIGNSIIPIRFNNRPELILVELNTK